MPRTIRQLLNVTLLLLCTQSVLAVEVRGLRMWPAPDNTRLVFDLDEPVEHTLFSLRNPDRLVIDLKDTQVKEALPTLTYNQSRLKSIRYAKRGDSDLRVVLDLNASVRPKSFVLKPHSSYGHRLVIDLFDKNEEENQPKPVVPSFEQANQPREVIVAIDAGHGGEDPGAIGHRGTREKDVVLGIARELEKLVQRERGMRPVMIRTGDYYVGLDERVDKAAQARADLFVSIHADAFDNSKAKGSSVFILSEKGASSDMARYLAESENNADLIGGVNLKGKDDLLKMVLVDMVKNSTIEDSHAVAEKVLSGLKTVNRLHKHSVEQAGFRVLKSPGIPSILVETAFISNPHEERKLRSKQHQRAMAKAIFNGVRGYFTEKPIPGTLLAAKDRKHRISRGETLSAIASRYNVSVALLKTANQLRGDTLRIGQTLRIPTI